MSFQTFSLLLFSRCHVQLFVTPWTAAHKAYLSFTISPSLPKFMSLNPWCHRTISSVIPFSFYPQSFPASESFPASGSFPVSQLFAAGRQSIGASASASVLPVSLQGWFPFRLTGLIALLSKELLRVFSTFFEKYNVM